MGALWVPGAATDAESGLIELATAAETFTGTDTVRAVTPDALRQAHGQPRREVRTTGAIAETIPWWAVASVAFALTAGRLFLTAVQLPTCTVANVNYVSGSTALVNGTTPHLWFALYDASLNLLGQSTDDTAATWAANTLLTKALATPANVTAGMHYVGVMCLVGSGGTLPTLSASVSTGGVMTGASIGPKRNGLSTSSLTTTAPNPAAAIGAGSQVPYAFVS